MKLKASSVIWGVLLILLGAIVLAQQLDWIAGWDTSALVVVLSILAVIAFAGYIASGWRNWGLLFPAAGLGGGALVAWLVEESATPDEVAGGLFIIIISVPFWIGFLVDRKRSWWALIPGWSLLAIGLLVSFLDLEDDGLVATLILLAIALPFYVVFVFRRQNWWALIVAVVMTIVAFVPTFAPRLEERGADDLIGAFFMLTVAIVFAILFYFRRSFWWALLTAGVTSTLALVILIDFLGLSEAAADRLIPFVLFGGLAVTFAVLYLRRERYPTQWAVYPAAALSASAVMMAIFGSNAAVVWALVFIALGTVIIAGVANTKRKKALTEPPSGKLLDKTER
jgi:hypothetical protein